MNSATGRSGYWQCRIGADVKLQDHMIGVLVPHTIRGAIPPGLRKVSPSKVNLRGASLLQPLARSDASRSRYTARSFRAVRPGR